MAQVSRRILVPKTEKKVVTLFLASLRFTKSQQETHDFIEDLLTPTEKIMLAKRLCIAYMLEKKYDYRTIRDTLHVSTGTIGDVAHMLKKQGKGIRTILVKIRKDEAVKKIFNEIGETILEALATSPGRNWSQSKSDLWKGRKKREEPF